MFRRHDRETAEARRSARVPSVLEGKICLSDGTSVSCKIKDLSTGGAKIEIHEKARLPDLFDLVIFEVEFRICKARLQWRNGNLAGISFVRSRDSRASAAG